MALRVDDKWAYNGLPIVRIENAAFTMDIAPTLGAKVLHLIDKAADRDVLYHSPRVLPHQAPLGANVDDHYTGGWDDVFPTGTPSVNAHADELPYLGEVWTLALDHTILESGPERVVVRFEGDTPITPAHWTRTVTIEGDAPVITLDTRIENTGFRGFDYIWGSHPGLAIREGFRIDTPAGGKGEVTIGGRGVLGATGETYDYPVLRAGEEGEMDVSLIPGSETTDYALHAISGLPDEAWVAVTDPETQRGFGIAFDARVNRSLWLWMAYGEPRGWYFLAPEPWISPQPGLKEAVEAGTAAHLEAGEAMEARMTAVLYSGVSRVSRIAPDGTVSG